MVSRNLVICDQEERYAAALAHFFMKTKELALGVQVCNSVAQALRLQEESPIDILLIGSGYPQEERQKVRAESVFVLTQSEDVAHETHEKLINKYGKGYIPLFYLFPLFPDDAICCVVGSLKVNFRYHLFSIILSL